MNSPLAYLRAEFLRARGSALQWLPLLGLPLAAMSLLFSQLASADGSTRALLGWQSMYVTGMAAPLSSIFAAVPETRELSARYGGLLWRAISPRRLRAARLLAVWVALAAFTTLNFGLTWAMAVLMGLDHAGIALVAGAWSWVASLGVVGISAALVRRYGLTAALAAAFAFQFAGIPASLTEGEHWWLFPSSWPIRLLLPVLGIHTNSVPLAPGDPLWQESPWPAAALCLLLAVAGALAACWVPPRRKRVLRAARRGQQPAGSADRASGSADSITTASAFDLRQAAAPVAYRAAQSGSAAGFSAAVRAVHRAALGPVLLGCVVATAVVLALTAATYPASYVHGVFTFAVLPLGTGTAAILAWSSLHGAWPSMLVENRHCVAGLLGWLTCLVAVVSGLAAVAGWAVGGGPGDELRRWGLSVVVGTVLAWAALFLVVRFNAATAAAVTVVWTVVSLTLGGDVLAETVLWAVALPAWPETADTAPRLSVALVLGLASAAITARALYRRLGLPIQKAPASSA
ncbi:hypothetical protein [Corynebacterium confusum]|uniref:hypothetical protein n=1 Tax=Corynebacterium confusum TaxID=71254 RepID=UPI0025B43A01|nr:hypothetical protein [Corynebacterium confusum]WJY89236.1 ABC-2 family transporter protein [Corynebacterium confusum]